MWFLGAPIIGGDEGKRTVIGQSACHSPCVSLEPSPRISVRNSPHQVADFRFQKFIRNDQRFHGVADVAAAGRDGLVGCDFKPIRFGLALGIGWHGVVPA